MSKRRAVDGAVLEGGVGDEKAVKCVKGIKDGTPPVGVPVKSTILVPYYEGDTLSTMKLPLDKKQPILLSNNSDRNCCVIAVAQQFAITASDMFTTTFDDHSILCFLLDSSNRTPLILAFVLFRDLVISGILGDRTSSFKSQNTRLSVQLKQRLAELWVLGLHVDCEDFAKLLDFCCFLCCYAFVKIFSPGSDVRSPTSPLDRGHCHICRALLSPVRVCCSCGSRCFGCCSVVPLRLEVVACASPCSSAVSSVVPFGFELGAESAVCVVPACVRSEVSHIACLHFRPYRVNHFGMTRSHQRFKSILLGQRTLSRLLYYALPIWMELLQMFLSHLGSLCSLRRFVAAELLLCILVLVMWCPFYL